MKKRDTGAAVVRAAMRLCRRENLWFYNSDCFCGTCKAQRRDMHKLDRACARHAAAAKKGGRRER